MKTTTIPDLFVNFLSSKWAYRAVHFEVYAFFFEDGFPDLAADILVESFVEVCIVRRIVGKGHCNRKNR